MESNERIFTAFQARFLRQGVLEVRDCIIASAESLEDVPARIENVGIVGA
jgi:hypothetical protein